MVPAGRPTLKASRSRNFQHSFAPVSLVARVSRFAFHVVCPLGSFLKILSCFFVCVLSEHPSKTRCRGSEQWWTCPETFNSLGGTSKVRSLQTKRKAQTFRLRRTHRGQMKTFHRFIAGTDSAAVQCEAKAVKALWATERSIRMFLFIVLVFVFAPDIGICVQCDKIYRCKVR
ncbi:hypothetical protein F5882DRAFT_155778 [Hyaloscypha sp. PMI_1271]|nr:hypothetical protein F5882DRAFT_155778 [Hyaloscypha sp. PMI_1271]